MTEAAAGDRWSECMNRDPDSHAQLSAGSKKERLTPGQSERERERGRDDRKDGEVIPDSRRSHSVFMETFSGEGELFSCSRDCWICIHHIAGRQKWKPRHTMGLSNVIEEK